MRLEQYLESLDPREGDPDELYRMIARASRLVVTCLPIQDAEVLFESRRREDLDDLDRSLRLVRDTERFHCMCMGSPSIELYRDDELLGRITNHHGISIRYSGSDWNIPVEDMERWIDWFSRRGMDGPRTEVEKGRRDAEIRKQ